MEIISEIGYCYVLLLINYKQQKGITCSVCEFRIWLSGGIVPLTLVLLISIGRRVWACNLKIL